MTQPAARNHTDHSLDTVEPDSAILYIFTDDETPIQPPTDKHLEIYQIHLHQLVQLTEREFISRLTDKDYIIFSRVEPGCRLISETTRRILNQCLGETAANILGGVVQPLSADTPANLTRYIEQVEEVIGRGACLIWAALIKELYRTLRSDPGALKLFETEN